MVCLAVRQLGVVVPVSTAAPMLRAANDAFLSGRPYAAAVMLREALRRHLAAECLSNRLDSEGDCTALLERLKTASVKVKSWFADLLIEIDDVLAMRAAAKSLRFTLEIAFELIPIITGTPEEPDGPVTVIEWAELYGQVNPRITSPRTMDRYRTTINNFDVWLGRPSTPEDLTADNYGRWVNHRRNIDHVAAGSLRGECEKLRAVWKWIAQRKGLPFPDTHLPRKVENVPETWVPEQVAKIDAAARRADWWIGGVPANLYYPAKIGIAVETGERHAAIHVLRWEDIDLENGTVTFRPETRKGRVKGSRKRITAAVVHDLRMLKVVSPGTPFEVVSLASLYHSMRRLLIEAGLPNGRNNMFHSFRRYHATQVHLAGGDASAALGHSDPSLVRKSYIDPTQLPTIIPSVRKPAAKPDYLAGRETPPCKRTVRRLRAVPRSLAEFLDREPSTADLNAETARGWLAWRAQTVNELSIGHDSRMLVQVWRWCYRNCYADEPVTYFEIQPGGYRRFRPRGCPDAEPGALTKEAQRARSTNPKVKAPPRPDVGWRGLLSRVFGYSTKFTASKVPVRNLANRFPVGTSSPPTPGEQPMRAWLFQDTRQKQKLGDKCPWSVGWLDPDGKRRSKRVGAKSMAEKFRLKKETELEHGIASPRAVTWAEFRKQHAEAILEGMSPNNREATEIAFQHFERIIDPKRMVTINTQTVDLYRTRRKREQARPKAADKSAKGRGEGATVSLATVNKELRHLRAAFNKAEEWGMIAKAPKFTMESVPKRDPAFVDDATFAKLYAACESMARPVQTHCEPQEWWQALLTFAYLTGWRIGEILELRRDDINYCEGVAFLPAEKTKGKRDIRVKLPEAVLDHVKRIQSFDELAFSWPHHRSTLHGDFRKLKEAAGVEFPGAFHRLRFGFANSNVDHLPADVLQHLMRHRSASTTRIYINDLERMRRQETGADVHVPAILRAGAAG
ncbi:unnamed protein product [Symbiodinium microadriaticum]|nr:unnamed protein product [Symbiodinium microadriaticum]